VIRGLCKWMCRTGHGTLISNVNLVYVGPGGRAVWRVCLGPPGCWDRASNPTSGSPDNDSAGMIRLTQRHYRTLGFCYTTFPAPNDLLGYIHPRLLLGVRLRSLASWDRGFESRWGHGCLSLVTVVCCQVEVSVTSWSLVQRSPSECGVSNECDREAL